MTLSDKLVLIVSAIKGEIKIESRFKGKTISSEWLELKWIESTKMFGAAHNNVFTIDDLLNDCEDIRSIPKLPLLTEEECEFLKWFPKEWWIARDNNKKLFIFEGKPNRSQIEWIWTRGDLVPLKRCLLQFSNIKWSDEDCFTIGDLIEYAKKVRDGE